MGKAKKSRHRYPIEQMLRPDEVTPEYQREVERSTGRLEREFEQARKRLEAAQRRAEKAGAEPQQKTRRSVATTRDKRLIDLWAEVQLRREELMSIERMMRGGSHTPQRNKGRGSFKPVGINPNRSLI